MATKKITQEENLEEEAVPLQAVIDDYEVRHLRARSEIARKQTELNEQFPKEVERQLKKGGAFLTYIPVSEVINRLNKVFGFDCWSYEIIKCERDALDPDFIVAHVRLRVTAESGWGECVKDGFGGQKIKRTKQGDIVDLGDEFKGAVSDALKKAAQALGVGLYLARTEEAMEAEAETQINPKVDLMWNRFVEISKSLSPEQKQSLGDFWVEYSDNSPKPTRATATVEDMESLIGWCEDNFLNSQDGE